jgi:hypothetical protein
MMKIVISILLIITGCNAMAQNGQPDSLKSKNYVYLSVGAPVLFCGFSYERLIYQKRIIQILPRAGFGLNIFRPSLGHEFDFHTGMTVLFGKKNQEKWS